MKSIKTQDFPLCLTQPVKNKVENRSSMKNHMFYKTVEALCYARTQDLLLSLKSLAFSVDRQWVSYQQARISKTPHELTKLLPELFITCKI